MRCALPATVMLIAACCAPQTAERPEPRPERVAAICGDPRLEGRRIAAIGPNEAGCGIAEPVELTAVAGVQLTGVPAQVNCTTARALADWVETGLRPADEIAPAPVVSMRVAAAYACRTRNGQQGARLSEHARGNAIDLSSFTLANGMERRVSDGWRRPASDSWFRRIHRAACGPFGTVLGPEADRFHQNHFHFDVARYRSGPFCR
ncbi:MAG: extensin family protein [Pseudomonadota bacterium]